MHHRSVTVSSQNKKQHSQPWLDSATMIKQGTESLINHTIAPFSPATFHKCIEE